MSKDATALYQTFKQMCDRLEELGVTHANPDYVTDIEAPDPELIEEIGYEVEEIEKRLGVKLPSGLAEWFQVAPAGFVLNWRKGAHQANVRFLGSSFGYRTLHEEYGMPDDLRPELKQVYPLTFEEVGSIGLQVADGESLLVFEDSYDDRGTLKPMQIDLVTLFDKIAACGGLYDWQQCFLEGGRTYEFKRAFADLFGQEADSFCDI